MAAGDGGRLANETRGFRGHGASYPSLPTAGVNFSYLPEPCLAERLLRRLGGSLFDSFIGGYQNERTCRWRIAPTQLAPFGATPHSLVISIMHAALEPGLDLLRVYDGDTEGAPLLREIPSTTAPEGCGSGNGTCLEVRARRRY